MKNRRRLLGSDEGTENFWPSFTDLTSTIALILFVLVLLAYIQNLIGNKNLEYAKAQLKDTVQRLSASQKEITSSKQKLQALAAEIEAGQNRLRLSQEQVAVQQDIIASSNEELSELRSRLRGIAVLRLDLLRKVKRSLEQQLRGAAGRSAPKVSISENGNIVIDESLVFEYKSYEIKPEGKGFLDTLARAFAKVLEDDAVRENIDVILVQGHTDERGPTPYNRDLSAKRANAVLDYMFASHAALEERYGEYFASSAYSEFRPVTTQRTEEAYRQNRRIEMSVVLKDANSTRLIDEYMKNLDPALKGPKAKP